MLKINNNRDTINSSIIAYAKENRIDWDYNHYGDIELKIIDNNTLFTKINTSLKNNIITIEPLNLSTINPFPNKYVYYEFQKNNCMNFKTVKYNTNNHIIEISGYDGLKLLRKKYKGSLTELKKVFNELFKDGHKIYRKLINNSN